MPLPTAPLLLTALLATPAAHADDGSSWLILPGAFYSQETSLGLAAYGSATFPLKNTGPETWPSTLSSALVYTLNRQVSVALWSTFYLGQDNTWIASGELIVSHYPTRYFGIGSDADPTWQDVTRRWVKTEATVLRRAAGPLYLGVAHGFSVTGLQDFGAPMNADGSTTWTGDHQLGSGIPGEAGGVVHGLGLVARHERRDNDQSTRSGTLLQLRTLGHHGLLGSAYDYAEASIDGRAFHSFGKQDGPDWTLAGQWLTELRGGDVPFTHMATLGGDNVLRGMYEGRYRDRSLTALQGELRFPIVWRFRGAAFAGSGQVFSGADDLLAAPPRWTAGGGLRFELDEVSHNTLRLDVGAGPDGLGFIFTFGEAF